MKQIYILISCCVSTLAMTSSSDQGWPGSLPLYARDDYSEKLLMVRSPPRRYPWSGPMQRAQNIPPQNVSPNRDQELTAASNVQQTRQSSLRSSSPLERSRSMPSSTGTRRAQPKASQGDAIAGLNTEHGRQSSSRSFGSPQRSQNNPASNLPQGARPGASQSRTSTSGRSQTQHIPNEVHKTVVRGAVIGPATVEMPGEDGKSQSTFIPWGRGEFVSASGGRKQGINVQTHREGSDRLGEASLGAQGQRAVRMTVRVGEGATGQIERKEPLPTWQRHISSGRTDTQTLFARPPPQNQYLVGDVKGEGEIRAMAYSPQEPAHNE